MQSILNFIFDAFPIFICGIVALAFLVVIAVMIAVRFSKKDPARRRQMLAAFAAENSLAYAPDDASGLVAPIRQVEPFRHYLAGFRVANVMHGFAGGREAVLFDFEVGSASVGGGPGGKTTYREVVYYHSACLHDAKLSCPDLVIRPRRVDDDVLNSFGCEEIAFESVDFSKAFRVKSADRKFACNICNPRVMELLLANRRFHVQITGGLVIVLTGRESKPEELAAALKFMGQFLDLIPEFVRRDYEARRA